MADIRKIVPADPSVMAEIDRWAKKYPRIHELWNGFMWRLSREPEEGYKFSHGIPEFIRKVERPAEDFPYITVQYTFDNEKIVIFNIKIIAQL